MCSRLTGPPARPAALRILALISLRAGLAEQALAQADEAVAAARAVRRRVGGRPRADGQGHDPGPAAAQLAERAAVLRGRARPAHRQQRLGRGARRCTASAAWPERAATTPPRCGHFRSALELFRQIDARTEIARCLAGIGWVSLAQRGPADCHGQPGREPRAQHGHRAAARRCPRARGGRRARGRARCRPDRGPARGCRDGAPRGRRPGPLGCGPGPARPACSRSAHQRLGPAPRRASSPRGRRLSMHEAVRYALAPARTPARHQPASPRRCTAATAAGARANGGSGPAALVPASVLTAREQRDRQADRARAVQPRHRRGTRHQPGNGRPARRQHPRQARRSIPARRSRPGPCGSEWRAAARRRPAVLHSRLVGRANSCDCADMQAHGCPSTAARCAPRWRRGRLAAGPCTQSSRATCIAEWAIQPMCDGRGLPNVITGTLGHRRRHGHRRGMAGRPVHPARSGARRARPERRACRTRAVGQPDIHIRLHIPDDAASLAVRRTFGRVGSADWQQGGGRGHVASSSRPGEMTVTQRPVETTARYGCRPALVTRHGRRSRTRSPSLASTMQARRGGPGLARAAAAGRRRRVRPGRGLLRAGLPRDQRGGRYPVPGQRRAVSRRDRRAAGRLRRTDAADRPAAGGRRRSPLLTGPGSGR